MKKIDAIMGNLGDMIPSIEKEKNKQYNSLSEITDLKNEYIQIDQLLIDFSLKYGFSFFANEVELTKSIELPPIVTQDNPGIPIGMIYGFGETKNSIKYLRDNYSNSDFLNQEFFPICDGVAGDIIFYSLQENNFGKIYYWFHEGDYESDKYLISNNFEEFLKNLVVKKSEIKSSKKDVVRTFISPKMLELMNKTRVKNGLPPTTAEELLNKDKDSESGVNSSPYKTYQGKDYTKEEWKVFEEEEYRKYVEKRSGKKSSFLADDKIEKQNFSAESSRLTEKKYFVMNSKDDKVPVYEYPSAMVAPFTFLNNGTAIEVIKYEENGWCEILSKEKKKAYIQSNFVKKNN